MGMMTKLIGLFRNNMVIDARNMNAKKEKIRYEGLPLPLILNGKVQDGNLAQIEKTRFWLKNKIQEKGAVDFKEVFFCSINQRGILFVDKKKKEDMR